MITISGLTAIVQASFAKAEKSFIEKGRADLYKDTYTVVPSNRSSESYKWLGEVPVVREWIGDKAISGLKDYGYTIQNKKWEATLKVSREAIEDDEVGVILPSIQTLAQEGQGFRGRLVSDLVINGTTNLAFDGQAFFANRSVNDNLLAGTGTTLAQLTTDLTTAQATMMQFVDDAGQPFGFVADTIVCPAQLQNLFKQIVASQTSVVATASGVVNPFYGSIVRVVVDPRLTDVNDWYLLCTDYPLRPFIYQERKAPTMTSANNSSDTNVFMRSEYLYSVEARGNAGYGFYQMAIKVVN
jgi:phage major head subunit gpT-like protein